MSIKIINPINTADTVNIGQPLYKSNTLGSVGLVLALVGIFAVWVPILGWLIWLLGFVLSILGLFKTPRTLAIAGLIISVVSLLFALPVFGFLAAAFLS